MTETHLILVVANKHNSRKEMAISKSGCYIQGDANRNDKPQEDVIYVPAQQHKHDTFIDQPSQAIARFHVSVPWKGGQLNSSDN